MTIDDVVRLIKDKDVGGELGNLFDDFLYACRHEDNLGVRYGSALLKLRRIARGHNLQVDEIMTETAEKFAGWLEANKR